MTIRTTAARHHLDSHPQAGDCRRLVDNARQLDVERAGLETHDLPFAVGLFPNDEIRVLGYRSGDPTHGLIEQLEARIWSLRSVLRGCARCSHVELAFDGGRRLSALRMQVEHVAGPPLDVYLPLTDDNGWWVEPGTPWLFGDPEE